jgi:hypothetical protein
MKKRFTLHLYLEPGSLGVWNQTFWTLNKLKRRFSITIRTWFLRMYFEYITLDLITNQFSISLHWPSTKFFWKVQLSFMFSIFWPSPIECILKFMYKHIPKHNSFFFFVVFQLSLSTSSILFTLCPEYYFFFRYLSFNLKMLVPVDLMVTAWLLVSH